MSDAPAVPRFLAEKIVRRPIDSIRPHPQNPNEGDVGAVGDSVDEVGFYSIIYVQKSTGLILAGETRWHALRERGAKRAPVVELDVDDATALRILVGDNEIPRRRSKPREDVLAEILTTLAQQTDAGLAGTGFDGDDLDRLIADLSTDFHHTGGGKSAGERKDEYDASEIRQIILIADVPTFERVIATMMRARVAMEAESNTDVVVAWADAWAAEHPE